MSRLFLQALIWNLEELDAHLNRHNPAPHPQSTNGNRWTELIAFIKETGDDQERFTDEESDKIAKHQVESCMIRGCQVNKK